MKTLGSAGSIEPGTSIQSIPMKFFHLTNRILLLLFLGLNLSAEAQITTFNLRNTFGFPACMLTSIHPTDTCYFVAGLVADTLPPHQTSCIFAKLDLDGNLIWAKTITSTEKPYATPYNSLIPLADGGFANTGYTYYDAAMHALFIRYDAQGDTLFTTEFLNPLAPTETFFKPRAMTQDSEGNFYLAIEAAATDVGIYQNSDFYILKLDSLGQKIWGNSYGGDLWELPFSILQNQAGEIVVGGVRTNQNLKDHNYDRRIYLLGLDTLGNELWTVFSSDSLLQYGAAEIVELSDGTLGVISGDGTEYWYPSSSSLYYENEIRLLTQDKEWSWKLIFPGPRESPRTRTTALIEAPDHHLVGAGFFPRKSIPNTGGGIYGWLAKVSPEGDSIWTRRYSGVESTAWSNEISDLKNTPDGGFIIVGQSKNEEPPIEWPLQRGWILKLDEYGCLVPDCQLLDNVSTTEPASIPYKTYPNPASEWLYLHLGDWSSLSGTLQLELVDMQGRVLQSLATEEAQITYLFEVAHLPVGLYTLVGRLKGQVVISERVVVGR